MVRIVDDFWENYKSFEDIIISSTIDLLRNKFPDNTTNNDNEGINFVILELHRLNIFQKWNKDRLTDDSKNIRKQFENFLYQRIWSILCNEYKRRKKRSFRFRRLPDTDMSPKTWKAPEYFYADEQPLNELPFATQEKERELRHTRAKRHPTFQDLMGIADLPEEANFEAEQDDVYSCILDVCKNDTERYIIHLKKDGLNNSEISDIIGSTPTSIYTTLKRIENAYAKLERLECLERLERNIY